MLSAFHTQVIPGNKNFFSRKDLTSVDTKFYRPHLLLLYNSNYNTQTILILASNFLANRH